MTRWNAGLSIQMKGEIRGRRSEVGGQRVKGAMSTGEGGRVKGEGSKEFRSADYDLHFIDKSDRLLNRILVTSGVLS